MSTQPIAEPGCPHCGDLVAVEGAFCCGGCEVAYSLVHEAGLDAYYERREVAGLRPEPLRGAWESVEPRPVDGGMEVRLCVDGLRCASCTWVVEKLLERVPGVTQATVSYANGRTRVVYDPQRVSVVQLAQTIASVGYSPRPLHATPANDDLLSRLGVASFCTANLMLLSASLYVGWFDGMEDRFQMLFRWTALALSTPIALYAAAPFFVGAKRGLVLGAIGMDVPVALAVAVLYVHGVVQTVLGAEGYLDSLGMLVTLLLVGRVLEYRGRRRAAEASAAIASALPAVARRRTLDGVEDVAVEQLQIGDVVEVGLGDDVPADGVVVDGSASVQMALLTGESRPVEARAGVELVAGARIADGTVGLRVERLGADTLAMRMSEAVRDAAARPMPPSPSDALAPVFTVVTLAIAVAAGGVWTWFAGLEVGLQVTVATLVVACPCALGLSVPLSVASGLGAVARSGVLFRDGGQLLALADVDTLAMDKTGTATGGTPEVLAADDAVLRVAGALERASRHPVARAILAEAKARGLHVPLGTDVRETAGVGVEGVVEGRRVRLASGGAGLVMLHDDQGTVGLIRLGDRLRSDAVEAVAALHCAGLRVVLLSGDHAQITESMAGALGVDEFEGGCTPEGKATWLGAHPRAAFVGDGLNDGPALAVAPVSLAMHTGATSSLWMADGLVTQPALRPVVAAVAGARATREVVRGNLRRALVYNTIAITAAVCGWINPLVAAILMPLSSAWIVWGALSVPRRMARLEAEWTSC